MRAGNAISVDSTGRAVVRDKPQIKRYGGTLPFEAPKYQHPSSSPAMAGSITQSPNMKRASVLDVEA
jgi:hypothetical protein